MIRTFITKILVHALFLIGFLGYTKEAKHIDITGADHRKNELTVTANHTKHLAETTSAKDTTNNNQPTGLVFDEASYVNSLPIDGVDQGFYIIANVFSNPDNAKKFVKLLNANGLNASYFTNPNNKWLYVYLKKHISWNNALISYYTKINDSYTDTMWIMRIKPDAIP